MRLSSRVSARDERRDRFENPFQAVVDGTINGVGHLTNGGGHAQRSAPRFETNTRLRSGSAGSQGTNGFRSKAETTPARLQFPPLAHGTASSGLYSESGVALGEFVMRRILSASLFLRRCSRSESMINWASCLLCSKHPRGEAPRARRLFPIFSTIYPPVFPLQTGFRFNP